MCFTKASQVNWMKNISYRNIIVALVSFISTVEVVTYLD